MPSTQTAAPLSSGSRAGRTRSIDPLAELPDTTDYELSPSAALPAVRLVAPTATAAADPTVLDPEARALFQKRLWLCCFVAACPFAFLSFCSATNFIDLFGRRTVGWTGAVLCGLAFVGLLATGAALFRARRTYSVDTLRVIEVAAFGVMALVFAYWQFQVLTAPSPAAAAENQYFVLAATLLVHFNWFALIVFHGVLVPNTLSRGVGVVAGMAAVALAIDGVAAATSPPTGAHAGSLFLVAVTMLLAAAGLSVFGTAKTAALRKEVETAKQAVRELGQYRLRRKLGAGGMGEVYLAEHRLLKRPCAIKRIHPKYLNNAEQMKRFEREVQTTARLRHPNTVEIYDYGVADDGTFYYVMEYLPGLSLEEIVSRYGPLPPERAVHLLRQVCSALREAHRLGLVHRDIKPSNILVFPDGSPHDQAKLVDFGLVQSLAAETDPDARITREGLIVGTPEYMSPEQAQGSPLDERSDLFSLGSVAYYLLTGQEAFHRENAMRTLLAVVSDEPKPLTEVNPHVPADLALVVSRCLVKAPDKRYLWAADLEAALIACGCADGWSADRAADWWDTHHGTEPGTDLNSLPLRDSLG